MHYQPSRVARVEVAQEMAGRINHEDTAACHLQAALVVLREDGELCHLHLKLLAAHEQVEIRAGMVGGTAHPPFTFYGYRKVPLPLTQQRDSCR